MLPLPMKIENITAQLKEKGCRTTPLRVALLEVLIDVKEPVSVQTLLLKLAEKGFKPNQTTLYRQLDTLVKHGVVDAVILNPKLQLFEIAPEHHHHFVCEGCNEVQDLHSDEIESAFHHFEHELEKRGLSIQKHELTFFGSCQSCH